MLRVDDGALIMLKFLLSKDEKARLNFLDAYQNDNSYYHFNTIETPKKLGVGVIEQGKGAANFYTWIKNNSNIKVLELFALKDREAIFQTALKLDIAGVSRVFSIQYKNSRSHEISNTDFIELINSQKNKSVIQERLKNYLLEISFTEEDRAALAAMDLESFLKTTKGQRCLDLEMGNLIAEIQKDCKRSGDSFIIPKNLEHSLECIDYEKEMLAKMSAEEKLNFVERHEVFIINNAVGKDYQDLIEAQTQSATIYKNIWENFISLGEDLKEKFKTIDELKEIFKEEKAEEFYTYPTANILNSIIVFCKKNAQKIIFPNNLKDRILYINDMNSEPEFLPEHERYLPLPNKNSYSDIMLTELATNSFDLLPVVNFAEAKKEFLELLSFCENLSKRAESYFEECFKSARLILSLGEKITLSKQPDKNELMSFIQSSHFQEFSEHSKYTLQKNVESLDIFFQLVLPKDKLIQLLVLSITNVMGGMGSWNDQYFEDENDNKDYTYSLEKFPQVYQNFFVQAMNS